MISSPTFYHIRVMTDDYKHLVLPHVIRSCLNFRSLESQTNPNTRNLVMVIGYHDNMTLSDITFRNDAEFDKELWEAQKKLRNSCLYMGPYYTGTGTWSAA